MQTTRKEETVTYPQSVGNLALADESRGIDHTPKAKTRSPQLRLVQDRTEEEREREALAPTIGIMNGIRLSLTLWSVLVIISYWISVGF